MGLILGARQRLTWASPYRRPPSCTDIVTDSLDTEDVQKRTLPGQEALVELVGIGASAALSDRAVRLTDEANVMLGPSGRIESTVCS